MTAQRLSIGQLARRAGVAVDTVRYYDRIGLVPPATRTSGGHRVYAPVAVGRLRAIRGLRALGFSLGDIRALLDGNGPGEAACATVRHYAEERLAAIRQQQAQLAQMEAVLSDLAASCAPDTDWACALMERLAAGEPDGAVRRG